MKRITNSFIKNIVRQSLNESYGLLNEDPQSKTYKTGPIMYGDVQYDNLDLTENPCPRGGFCLTPAKKSAYSIASNFVKITKIPTDIDAQVAWMDTVINLCNDPDYAMGESMDETTINNTVTEIIDEMDDTNIDEGLIKKKIVSLGDFPSFCVANEYSNRMSYNIFNSDAKNRVAGGGGDDADYKTYIVMPVFGLLQNSVNKSKKFETTFWESVASAAKTQKPKPNTTTGGGGTPNTNLPIDAFPCIIEHPALINKKEPLDNGFGFKLKTGVPIIDSFIFGVTKDPNIPDSTVIGKKYNTANQLLLDFDCNDKYIQYSLSNNIWEYDDVVFAGSWIASVGGKVALTTNPDLEDDGKLNKSIQFENIKGFRYNLLTEVELKYDKKKFQTGPDVVAIQTKLGISTVGGYGPGTKAAVEKFQKDNGLLVTGDVDETTYKAIMAIKDPVVPSATGYTRDLTLKSTGPDVVTIQTRLGISTKGGYGPETENKVKEFQRKYKLSETGIVNKDTFEKIMSVKAAGEPVTFTGKKHNYIVGDWVKVNPGEGNVVKQLADNSGFFRITHTPDEYTIILDLNWDQSSPSLGGSTQKVLFGEQSSEGSKTIIKRGSRDQTNTDRRSTSGDNSSGKRSNTNNSGTNTVDPEKQRQRDIRNKEFCDTLRQIKQYLNNTKEADLTVNCKKTQKTINQIMMALSPETPVAPIAPIEEPKVTTPGGNVTVY